MSDQTEQKKPKPAAPKTPALQPGEPRQLAEIANDRQLLCARFSACGKFLAAGDMEGNVRRWSIGEDEPVALPHLALHHSWVGTLEFHPAEKIFFSADSWGRLICADIEGEAAKPRWQHDAAHDGWIRQLSVSPDGKLLATCGRDQTVRMWQTTDGKPIAKREHTEDVFAITFTPDGQGVVFADARGSIQTWDFVANTIGKKFDAAIFYKLDRIQDIPGVRVLTFLDGGKTLLAAGCLPDNGGTLQGTPMILFFDAASGKLDRKFTQGAIKDGFVQDLAVHPGGFLIAATNGVPGTGMIFLHRPADKEPYHISTKLVNCQAVALHPDRKRFAVVATNRNSAGNGRPRSAANGEYPGNTSPVHLFELPA